MLLFALFASGAEFVLLVFLRAVERAVLIGVLVWVAWEWVGAVRDDVLLEADEVDGVGAEDAVCGAAGVVLIIAVADDVTETDEGGVLDLVVEGLGAAAGDEVDGAEWS